MDEQKICKQMLQFDLLDNGHIYNIMVIYIYVKRGMVPHFL